MDRTDQTGPALYTEAELDALEAHIQEHYGPFDQVLHEIESPDIHVDIALIRPTPERDYHILITMGMGAAPMQVPGELKDKQLHRAELVVCLPPDWTITTGEENWYWPIRWLKMLARMPGQENTWLGWGHSIPAPEPIADTRFTGMLLVTPGAFAEAAAACDLPGGETVNFYQMIPLYQEEVQFKRTRDATALLDRMTREMLEVVRPDRPNACEFTPSKNYKLRPEDIKPLIDWEGPAGCLATDRITVDGCRVGYLYREEPEPGMPDCGWRFSAGDESEDYMQDPANSGIYALNTICNCDPEIIPLLHAPAGSAFYRDENGVFREAPSEPAEEAQENPDA